MEGLTLDEYIKRVKKIPIMKIQGDIFEKTSLLYLKKYGPEGYTYNLYGDFSIKDKMYFDLPRVDHGVDIVGINREIRKILLVQCKYTSNKNKTITYARDKLSHLSAMELSVRKERPDWTINTLVITTGKDIYVHDKHTKSIVGTDLCGLLEWIETPIKEQKIELRPYQSEIIEKMERHFLVSKKRVGRIVMATGTGKTLTILKYIEKNVLNLSNPRVLIVTNSKLLAKQTHDIFNSVLRKGSKVERNHVLLISQDGIRDPKIISMSSEKIHVSTYESMDIPIENCRYNLVVFDESHHSESDIKKSLIDKIDKNESRILYMTATEKTETLGYPSGENIAKYSIGDGIRNGFLSDYRVNIYKIHMDKSIDISKIDRESLKSYKYRSMIIGLLDKILDCEMTKIVIYCKDQSSAKLFKTILDGMIKNVKTDLSIYIDLLISEGHTSNKRDSIQQKFLNADIGIIINVRMLIEGIDIPQIDTIVFADNTDSKINIIQAIGRSLRISPGKKYSNICMGIYVSETDKRDTLSILEKQEKKMGKFLQYLKEEDSTYMDYSPEYIKKYRIIETYIRARNRQPNTKQGLDNLDLEIRTPQLDTFDSNLNRVDDILETWKNAENKQKFLIDLQKKDKKWNIYLKIWTWILQHKTYPEYFTPSYSELDIVHQEQNDIEIIKAQKFAGRLAIIRASNDPFDKIFVLSLSKLIVHQSPKIWKEAVTGNIGFEKLRITSGYQKILSELVKNTDWLRGVSNSSPPNGLVDMTVFIPNGLGVLGDYDQAIKIYQNHMTNLIKETFGNLSVRNKEHIKNIVGKDGICKFLDLIRTLDNYPVINKLWTIYHFVDVPVGIRDLYKKIVSDHGLEILASRLF